MRTLSYLFAALLVAIAIRMLAPMTYALAILLGLVAGVLAGLFGVGGGILFVPTLTWLGLTQLHAEATSLLAIIPTVLVGVWRQQRLRATSAGGRRSSSASRRSAPRSAGRSSPNRCRNTCSGSSLPCC